MLIRPAQSTMILYIFLFTFATTLVCTYASYTMYKYVRNVMYVRKGNYGEETKMEAKI